MRYTSEELRLLFLEAIDRERRKFERLRQKFSGAAGGKVDSKREQIPESVRIFVWRRDEGRCVKCGSQEKLEFDHIIPISKGGSSTERNIQLLCESCNREKSDKI
jgi:5-methylcytosine-specific restriction endonuclease McrA